MRPKHRLNRLLEALSIAKSSYEYTRAVREKDRYVVERPVITELFDRSGRTYGYRRMKIALLRQEGLVLSEKVVRRLMREEGLTVKPCKRKRYGSFRGVVGEVSGNLLKRDFRAERPCRKWATDITEFRVGEGKTYLSAMLDLFNGEVVAFTLGRRPDVALVLRMLEEAASKRDVGSVVIHSDQGHHYQREAYCKLADLLGIRRSMSRKGNCLDNACAESFFSRLKTECFYPNRFKALDQLEQGIPRWIDWYNKERIKTSLGSSPVDYRMRFEASGRI